jgi:hypothetical protein
MLTFDGERGIEAMRDEKGGTNEEMRKSHVKRRCHKVNRRSASHKKRKVRKTLTSRSSLVLDEARDKARDEAKGNIQ